ncbi:GNAT family N-acetyltransferase [Gorillibacterium timonense]|uniref:GNAT family N-acetyltransferase n=1 Tax=Gorillibacterium timonense TaxID=1689269 RepID=UPI00071CF1D6|nr:GNAT family N-acetyltransferase [Gorillibacterium timonense]
MNPAKKLVVEQLPQGFTPKSLPEIIRLAKNMNKETAVVHQNAEGPVLFETDRLIIRRFTDEDGEAVCVLANDKEASPLAGRDHKWPTDQDGCREAARYFASEDSFWAVCLKPDYEMIGMITFNSVDEFNRIDLGHVWRMPFMRDELDSEAIALMIQYAFEKKNADGVYAYNPLDYEAQLHPLKQSGMEVVEVFENASFPSDAEDTPPTFTGCKMMITRKA